MVKIKEKNQIIFQILIIILFILCLFINNNNSLAQYKTKIKVASTNLKIINYQGNKNLYGTSTIYNSYYNANGKWVSTSSYVSMLVDVNPGDKIIANSFMANGSNGNTGTLNGIRVTYLLNGVVVSTLDPEEVYAEYSTNGYITVPKGADQVNVTWWSESENNWLYILNNTNFYNTLEVYNKYYNSSGQFVDQSSVVSVIADVKPGDKIIANSFMANGSNGNTASRDGIRVTFLLDGLVVSTLEPEEVYAEYSTNGYIKIPEGVNQVNVPWWSKNEKNWLYKLS